MQRQSKRDRAKGLESKRSAKNNSEKVRRNEKEQERDKALMESKGKALNTEDPFSLNAIA